MPPDDYDDTEPKRIARSTRAGMGPPPRLRIGRRDSGRGVTFSGNRSRNTSVVDALPQRVVAKVRVVRHASPRKGRDSLRAHVAYLSREAVTREADTGRFYDAEHEGVDAKQHTRPWRDDRHHFRIILSPENAGSLDNLSEYVREVMRRVERDLGPIDWLAVNHRNTESPHAHLLFRGKAIDGSDLVISRDYVSHGIRQRAAEVATEWLGERTRDDAQIALGAEIRAERYTSLDRTLERFAQRTGNTLQIDLQNVTLSRFSLTTREMLAERVAFLNQLGLAERAAPARGFPKRPSHTWNLATNYQAELRKLGERNDIIKQLYGALGHRAARLAPGIEHLTFDKPESAISSTSVRGVLIAKGALDETSDERFVVIEDAHGRSHYARIWSNKTLDTVEIGGIIEVGRAAHWRQRMAHEVIAVARSQPDGLYSTDGHRAWLQQHRNTMAAEQVHQRLQRFARPVAWLSRQSDSGIARASEAAVKVAPETLTRFISRRNRWIDIRVTAVHSLKSQISAEAYTWLDRQIIRERLTERLGKSDLIHVVAVRDAMAQRAQWLVEHGFAKPDSESQDTSKIRFEFGATEQLKRLEHKKVAEACKKRHGKSVSFLKQRDTLRGTYRGVVHLHRGMFAFLSTKDHIFLAPISREPRFEPGRAVKAQVVGRSHTKFHRVTPPSQKKTPGIER